jgi:ABC-type Na+ efflux pump permease subunit
MNKLFDLRFVIGLFFLIIGLLLMGYVFLSDITEYQKEVNLYCGLLFTSFGLVMFMLKQKNKE